MLDEAETVAVGARAAVEDATTWAGVVARGAEATLGEAAQT